jgi:hypothetical protein
MPDLILFYDAARFALAAGTLADGVFSETWSRQMDINSLGGFTQVATATDRTIFYNPYSGQTRIFHLGVGDPALLADYPVGGAVSRFWTHVLAVGDLFFYNSVAGSGALATIAGGTLVTGTSFGAGVFSTGWTHVAALGTTLLFYDTMRGAAALGVADSSGFRTLHSYEAGALSSGWTHVISSGDRFLFYNMVDWSSAIATVSGDQLITETNLAAGQFPLAGPISSATRMVCCSTTATTARPSVGGSFPADSPPESNIPRAGSPRTGRTWSPALPAGSARPGRPSRAMPGPPALPPARPSPST